MKYLLILLSIPFLMANAEEIGMKTFIPSSYILPNDEYTVQVNVFDSIKNPGMKYGDRVGSITGANATLTIMDKSYSCLTNWYGYCALPLRIGFADFKMEETYQSKLTITYKNFYLEEFNYFEVIRCRGC
jgi:hypothetical protein